MTEQFFARAAGATVGDVNIFIDGADSPAETAQSVRQEMTKIFEELAE